MISSKDNYSRVTKDGELKNGFALWSEVENESNSCQEFGLIINKAAEQHIQQYKLICPTQLWARMKVVIIRLLIIVYYALVNGRIIEVKNVL